MSHTNTKGEELGDHSPLLPSPGHHLPTCDVTGRSLKVRRPLQRYCSRAYTGPFGGGSGTWPRAPVTVFTVWHFRTKPLTLQRGKPEAQRIASCLESQNRARTTGWVSSKSLFWLMHTHAIFKSSGLNARVQRQSHREIH